MRVIDDAGRERDATFHVETIEAIPTIVFESRGGARGATSERNREYAAGLEILLERLKVMGATITDALIETARSSDLPPERRRLVLKGRTYPLALGREQDVPKLRQALSAAQAKVGQTKGAKGGNPTKRIRLLLDLSRAPVITESRLGALLSTGKEGLAAADVVGGAAEVARAAAEAAAEGFFDAKNGADERKKISRAIAQRQGQPTFRRKLLAAYAGKCAMTGCDAEPALEAAHILPYKGTHTHHVQNGLLLRADLHTLFDRGLVAVDTRALSIIVATPLRGTVYGELHGKRLTLPLSTLEQPSPEALDQHREAAGL